MGVTYINTNPIGTGGQNPVFIFIQTTDSDSTVSQPNYLVPLVSKGYNFFNGQMALVQTSDGTSLWDVVVSRVGRAVVVTLVLNTDGCVTNVTGVSPIVSSGGLTPAISLASKGIGTGSVTNANVSFDDKGLITAISSGSPDMIPFQVLTANHTLQANHGYFTNSVSVINLATPSTFVLSDEFEISNINTGGWRINLNAGQFIRVGNVQTSSGGSLASSDVGDSVRLVASDANNLIVLSGVTNDFVIL